jgi:hypothetical protein
MRAAVLVPLVFAAACGPEEDRASDLALHDAITRLRDDTGAGATDRRLRLVTVQQLPARTAAAIDAQRACSEAYRELLDAQDQIAGAELHVTMAASARANPASYADEVARAEKRLAAAKAAMPGCDAAAARLAVAAR